MSPKLSCMVEISTRKIKITAVIKLSTIYTYRLIYFKFILNGNKISNPSQRILSIILITRYVSVIKISGLNLIRS